MAGRDVLSTGDLVVFNGKVGDAIIAQLGSPVELTGSGGPLGLFGETVCIEGDELPESIASPMPYMTAQFPIPGSGTLAIDLDDSHLATKLTSGGRKLLRIGGDLKTTFTVDVPATRPSITGVDPDKVEIYEGTAGFLINKARLLTTD